MLLEVKDLQTHFRTSTGLARAVDGISFGIKEGETLAIVGESGCGKSVTALSIMQLVPKPAGFHPAGAIQFDGEDLMQLPEAELRRVRGNDISMIFQEPMTSLNPVLTVGYQLTEPLIRHQGMDRAQARERAIELLEQVHIPGAEQRFGEYAHQLSGGMKQRAMIAMAMACQPKLLIADEPTTALDVTIQAQILDLMKELQTKRKTAVLLITHDLGVVAEVADRIAVMYGGEIVEIASKEKLLSQPSHPYTVRLLQSLPSSHKHTQALQTIHGRVPPATDYPEGCRFYERCHVREDACLQTKPKLNKLASGHVARCLLYDKAKAPSVRRRISRSEAGAHSKKTTAKGDTLVQLNGLKVHFAIRRGVLKKTVGYVKAVDGVDLAIPRGRTLALVGESGCGKSTLARGLLRLEDSRGGEVVYDGRDLLPLDSKEMHPYRNRLQVIFQDPYSSLNPRMMVGQIIREGMVAHGIGKSRAERDAKVKETLNLVGLDESIATRYPHEFSGGQRQRIGIARALAVDPEFIVCDEATSALDVSVQAQILNLLKDLQQKFGLTYLFITHDLSVVRYLADEVAVMYLGRIIERGAVDDVFRKPAHPYTEALLSAIPEVSAKTKTRKIRLSGDIPSPIFSPAGCHFHPRCSKAFDLCSQAYPVDHKVGKGQTTKCHLYWQGAKKR